MNDIIRIFADEIGGGDNDTSDLNLKPEAVGTDGSDLAGSIIGILNGVIGIIAVICVVVIVIGGVQYMTSSGDAGKVKKAKDTILYAVIGLVVCALAATIVNFVIANLLK